MDRTTINTYTGSAAAYAAEWAGQPSPDDLYAHLARFFQRGGRTADIGCGSGRDVAWLNAHGYPAEGYDASDGLIAEARSRYPAWKFELAALPDLESVTRTFDNVLCETVIMHLPVEKIAAACKRLAALLAPRGVLYLSAHLERRKRSRRRWAALQRV